MSAHAGSAEARNALADAWARVPEKFRGPTQFLGRQYAGCGATIGAMPRCDFSCTGCYLGGEANRARPRPLAEIESQLRDLRTWLGPAGNLQLTDGELTLRSEPELLQLIARARQIGLVPMLMTHGETFRRKPGLLERLMTKGGLSEVSFHVDTTMRGRRDGYAEATCEAELDGLRAEFATMVRAARQRTGRRLEAVSTVTVTRENLDQVPDIVRFFLANADAFKMVSFQPLAQVGRTDPTLQGVGADELWERIAEGTGDPAIRRGEGWLGHPACSRFVQGVVPRGRAAPRFVPLYQRSDPSDMEFLNGLLDRAGGDSGRLDDRPRPVAHALGFLARHPRFALRHGLPFALRLVRRIRTLRADYFSLVSHHFMSAAEMSTPLGQERLALCAFRVAIDGRLESMCRVNAGGLRERFYDAAAPRGAAA